MRAITIYLTGFLALCLLGGGCAPAPLVRVTTAEPTSGPPRIRRIVDLGGLAPRESGVLDTRHSDSWLTPGEWVAVVGDNLDRPDAKVEACGVEAMAVGHLQGGALLVRLPRSDRWKDHGGLSLTTPAGSDRKEVACRHSVAISDMRDNGLKIWRTSSSDEEPLVAEPSLVSLPRSGPIALGDNGALLYAAGRSSAPMLGRGQGPVNLIVVHLAAVPAPAVTSSTPVEGKGQPVGMAVDDPRRILALAFENELVLLSLEVPTSPRVVGRLSIGESLDSPTCVDGPVFMPGSNRLMLLDALGNALVLVDITDPSQPRIAQRLELSQGVTGSVSIAMADRLDEAGRLHVLTGTNVSLARTIGRGKAETGSFIKAPPGLATVELRDGRVSVVNQMQFPGEWIPVDLAVDPDGGILISVVGMDADKLLSIETSAQGLLKMIGALKDTAQFGQIWRVAADSTVEVTQSGLSLFLTPARLRRSGPVLYTNVRPSVRPFPPSIGVALGMDIAGRQNVVLRRLEWTALLPPYVSPWLVVQ